MSEANLQIRCMRCGTQMEMRDPGPGQAWTPDQFWVCPKCGYYKGREVVAPKDVL